MNTYELSGEKRRIRVYDTATTYPQIAGMEFDAVINRLKLAFLFHPTIKEMICIPQDDYMEVNAKPAFTSASANETDDYSDKYQVGVIFGTRIPVFKKDDGKGYYVKDEHAEEAKKHGPTLDARKPIAYGIDFAKPGSDYTAFMTFGPGSDNYSFARYGKTLAARQWQADQALKNVSAEAKAAYYRANPFGWLMDFFKSPIDPVKDEYHGKLVDEMKTITRDTGKKMADAMADNLDKLTKKWEYGRWYRKGSKVKYEGVLYEMLLDELYSIFPPSMDMIVNGKRPWVARVEIPKQKTESTAKKDTVSRDHEGCSRGFHRLYNLRSETNEKNISIGMYADDGGTTGEFGITWVKLGHNISPQFNAFDDSWHIFPLFKDLFDFMDKTAGQDMQPEEFCKHLQRMGIKDLTNG